ncbi:MAG: polyphosphate:AMP phosphotransferase [bacterium]|nr:polyphosphate:AMP phosphotransferase [bacterium]
MLEKINLNKSMTKEEYKEYIDTVTSKLALLQRECKEQKIPIMILMEGWSASGKGTLINKLIMPLDPRGFKVYAISEELEEEKLYPYLRKYWIETPAKGRIHIFDQSYYSHIIKERVFDDLQQSQADISYDEITEFEKQLSDAGTILIKFFLHISKKEQEKRFRKLEEKKATSWRVTKQDWKYHGEYGNIVPYYDDMIAKTDTEYAPWTIVEATDRRYATAKILDTVVARLKDAVDKVKYKKETPPAKEGVTWQQEKENPLFKPGVLTHVDLTNSYTKEEYQKRLKELQGRLTILHSEILKRRIPVVLALEGWDAAGKGGAIKRLTQALDPRGYEVIPISAPNDEERAHHYLWRFFRAMPKAGHIAIFDRTWYGRVLVERVEGFCSKEEYKRAYNEINRMEELLTNSGCVVIKFWLHIDKDEQEKRFTARQEDPEKQWKITEEDWRNRSKWDLYEEAVDEMVVRTSTTNAPWVIVEANSKYYARIKILETVVNAIEEAIKKKKES